MKLEEVAEYVQNILLEQGFIIHRYNAYSTNSIYLKLDYGACCSIRISDHKGKEYLSYKYNIIKNTTDLGWRKDNKDKWRFICSTNKLQIDNLIKIILDDRQYRKCFTDYDMLVKCYKIKSRNDIGFWQKAWEVNNGGITRIAKTDNK